MELDIRDFVPFVDIAGDEARVRHPRVKVSEIVAATAVHYGLTIGDIECASRARTLAYPRQIAFYLARELTNCSYPQIGRLIGGRDHTTALFAVRKLRRILTGGGDDPSSSYTPARWAKEIQAVRELALSGKAWDMLRARDAKRRLAAQAPIAAVSGRLQ